MQIYYCDACGLRVNNSELVPAGDKVFCNACAQKQAPVTSPPRRTPSGGVVLPQRPKTDGYAIPTPLRGHAATQRPPSPAAGSNFGSGNHPVYPSSGTHRATGGNERPRTGHTAAISRPASPSRSTNTKNPDNSTMIYAGAGAGVMLLVVVIVFAMRGSPAPDTQTNSKKDPPKPVEVTPPKTVTPPVVVQPPEPPKKVTPDMDDIRERSARREFDAAMKRVREAGSDVIAARRPLEDFLRRYRSTQAGQEALAFVEKQAKANGRTADTPSKTEPGLKVELYERPGDWDEIRNRDLRSLKKYKDMKLDKVDMGGTQSVEQTFSRKEFLAAVITGFLDVPTDGEYNLSLNSDDASFLIVGDWKVVEHDGSHAASEYGDMVPLKKGKHRIRINYSQGSGEAVLQFFWSGPGIGKQIVPPNVLSHEP